MKVDQPEARCYRSFKIQSTDFALTLLPEAWLSLRLFAEAQFVIQQLRRSWPKFKGDPVGSVGTAANEIAAAARRAIARPQMACGLMTSVLIVTSVIVAVLVLERHAGPRRLEDDLFEFDVVTTLSVPSISDSQKEKGGADEKGRVGLARGAGEGSAAIPARAHGGGSGGNRDPLPASQGRIPFPSIIPAPIPTAAVHLPQALPVAGIDLDPALYRRLDYSAYGDPRSRETTRSNGPGEGGGVGTHDGTGVGNGSGGGFGDGQKGNTGDGERNIGSGDGGAGCAPTILSRGCIGGEQVFNGRDVATRPRVISKPEPTYTEQARRNQVTGTVVLRVVFSSNGEVTNIQPIQNLSDGLTEKAIAAAKQIRFVPATREGHPVSTYMQLEYNFNLY